MEAFCTCSHDFEIASKCRKCNLLLLKISLISISLLSQYFGIFGDFFSALVTYNLQYQAISISHFPDRGTYCMHWWRGLSLDCSLLKDRSRKRQLWKQPYTSRNCCTYSFLKQSTMIISPGKAEQHIFKSNHTQRDLLPVLPTHQLIKSILKNVSVSVCNLFELLISAFHGPLAEQPYLSLFVRSVVPLW